MPSPAGTERFFDRSCRVAAALGLLSFVIFLPAVACDFVNWDDDHYVFDNALVLSGLTPEGIRRAWKEPVFNNWAPLTILSYQFDASVFGTAPWGFHLTNVVLHAVSTGLLYMALLRMTGFAGRSAAATVLWAVHPLRVESVAWIAERKDVLSVFFLMLALLAYDRYCRRPGVGRYLAVAGGMLGSLLCKSTLVTLPVLLLLLDVWPLGRLRLPWCGIPVRGDGGASPYPARSWRQVVSEKLPLVAISVVFVVVTLIAQAEPMSAGHDKPFFTSRIPNALNAIVWYLRASFWPTGLIPVHQHVRDTFSGVDAAGCLLGIGGLIWAAGRLGRSRPFLPVGLAFFLVALMPMLGFVQTGEQGHADRFTYVPHVGLCVAVVWSAADLLAGAGMPVRTQFAAVGLVAVVLVAVSEWQLATWRNADTLWTHVLAVDPNNFMAHVKRGHRLSQLGRHDEAERHFLTAERGTDGASFVVGYMARFYFDKGEFAKARECRDRVIAVEPDSESTRALVASMRTGPPRQASPEVRAALKAGLADARATRFEPALGAFLAAIELDPACAEAHNNAGLACVELGRLEDGRGHFRRAIELNPHNADYRVNAVQLLCLMGLWEEAGRECEIALEIDPFDAEARQALARIRKHVGRTP
jgi:tetratricopeptide (TPR) repeat protein